MIETAPSSTLTTATPSSKPSVEVSDLGLVDYRQAWDVQKSLQDYVIEGGLDQLILCEHPPTVTYGKRTEPANLLFDEAGYAARGLTLLAVDRGGDVTTHEPGQLVIYPILDLRRYRKDLKWYLRQLEASVIQVLTDLGLPAGRVDGRTGVWLENQKVCAMGIRVVRWVTMHGLALNVNNSMASFATIVPCGIADAAVTRLADWLDPVPSHETLKASLIASLAAVFGFDPVMKPSESKP